MAALILHKDLNHLFFSGMKIMDLSGDDGECQGDAVVDSKTKKCKQGKEFLYYIFFLKSLL